MSESDRLRSDVSAAILVALDAELDPEGSASLDVDGTEEQIVDWSAGSDARAIASLREVARHFDELAASETSVAVVRDLAILAREARSRAHRREVESQLLVPLYDPLSVIVSGIGSASRPEAALARLARYTGQREGTLPLTVQAEARTRELLAHAEDRWMPDRVSIERSLAGTPVLRDELRSILGENPEALPLLDLLETQIAVYDDFLRTMLLPIARSDARMPPEIYSLALQEVGIDVPPRELAASARAAFVEIQSEMQPLAIAVAGAHGWPDTDYRAVLGKLKEMQVTGGALLEMYRARILELEAILERERIVTLPSRPLAFRLATETESVMLPAPMYLPPPLLGTKATTSEPQSGTFVLPSRDPSSPSGAYDDFSFEAASYWLTAHEGRPGHDLQYTTLAEHPPSLARAIYAFNSVNAEGWGLYAESLVAPHVPAEAQLAILQARLMRAAHAFLDIELNMGIITPDEVRRVMTEEVGFSPAWAETCLLRYTSLMPGQAPSYFYGYTRLVALREEAELRFGKRFDPRAFHDAILAQGLLPPDEMRTAILSQPSHRTGAR